MPSITPLRGVVYPDKSFSIGIVPREKKGRNESIYDRLWNSQEGVDYFALADWLEGKTNVLGDFVSLSENPDRRIEVLSFEAGRDEAIAILQEMEKVTGRDFSKFYDCTEDMESPLLVKSVKSSRKSRGSYGKHGITKFGKRVCKNVCILLQQRYGLRRLGFGTCTIPAIDREICQTIIAHWGDIVRRFYQKLRRLCHKRNTAFIYVGCTEIQEKRFDNTGLPVPHLHFVYVSKVHSSGGYTFSTKEAYNSWNDAVNEVLVLWKRKPIMGTGNHRGSVKLEPIHTSTSAYLGKYISKGVSVVKKMQEEGYDKFPKQWWTASQTCKEMFQKSLVVLTQQQCANFFYNFDAWMQTELVSWGSRVYVNLADREYCVGVVCQITQELYDLIVSDLV